MRVVFLGTSAGMPSRERNVSSIAVARGADMLIHESTYAGDMAVEAHERFHSTCVDAARVAAAAGVQRLMLTHFSTRYVDVAPLVDEARGVFADTEAATDLMEVTVWLFLSSLSPRQRGEGARRAGEGRRLARGTPPHPAFGHLLPAAAGRRATNATCRRGG